MLNLVRYHDLADFSNRRAIFAAAQLQRRQSKKVTKVGREMAVAREPGFLGYGGKPGVGIEYGIERFGKTCPHHKSIDRHTCLVPKYMREVVRRDIGQLRQIVERPFSLGIQGNSFLYVLDGPFASSKGIALVVVPVPKHRAQHRGKQS